MKFKKLLLVAALSACCVSLQAQNSTDEKTPIFVENSYWSNCFVGVGGGALVYFGDYDAAGSFGGRVSGTWNVNLGKWFTPNLGMRATYMGAQTKGYSLNSGKFVDQKWLMTNLRADVMLNLSNTIAGYKADRIYNAIPYVGFGWMRNGASKYDEFAANVGLQNNFRISDSFDVNLDIMGAVVKSCLDSEAANKSLDGMVSVSVGVTYKFKQRGWRTYSPANVACVPSSLSGDDSKTASGWKAQPAASPEKTAEAIETAETKAAEADAKIKELTAENEKLRNQLDKTREELAKKPAEVKEAVVSSSIIFFEIGATELSNENRVTLSYVAETLKADQTNKVFTIIGYADSVTGSVKRNEVVSKMRAEAVYQALTQEFDVAEEQLKIEYKGGVEAMFFNDASLNRAVVIE